ncbi:MAG: response regulator [Alphaproteobacteria bacterium]|nr:response regulator [Alphaproteobacteria bacterium]MBV9542054.1 response regulator [Alphaproteobacteria bacterium]
MSHTVEKRLLDGLSVLVVEDEAIISFLLEDMVSELGAIDVRHAGSVQAALNMIEERLPDLAVLDVNLGGTPVYPVAERLEAAGVTFIFTTGYGRAGLVDRWTSKTVVQKPFDIDAMSNALSKVVAPKR